MAEHTKEPWEVIPPSPARPSQIGVVGHRGQVTIYDAPLTGETEANAMLIAAAPDLLAACLQAREAMNATFEWTTVAGVNPTRAALMKLDAAINKAEPGKVAQQ